MTSSWYLASAKASVRAQTTFEKSLSKFKDILALTSTKHAWVDDVKATTRLQDVIDEVNKAKAQYDNKNNGSKLYKHITSFSRRVVYYGKVLDVMVQHHPEYVSLAWGTLKLVFGVIVEHERLGSTIVIALNDIGDALSRIDLAESLYPTEKMKDTIVILNCHVIAFLCRALDWYKSSSLSRTIQSFTRPAALRYDDLIGDINKTLAKVGDLSQAGGQAEQRDMHMEMHQEYDAQQNFRSTVQNRLDEMEQQLNTLIQQKYSAGELKAVHQEVKDVAALVALISKKQTSSEQTLLQALVLMKQDIQATQADIRVQISEVQFTQGLSFISARCAIDHQVAYEKAFVQRRARRVTSSKCAPFWNSQQFKTWDQLDTFHIITLNSGLRDRLNVRDFYVGIIEQLLNSYIPVFWIIEQKYPRDQQDQRHDLFEVMRSLVAQALKAALKHTDGVCSQIRNFEAASSIADYTSLLVHNLSQFKRVYIFVDANAILPDSMADCHRVLLNVPDLIRDQNKQCVVKIMLLNHGNSRGVPGLNNRHSAVVRIAQTSKRKSRSVPQAPLKGSRTNLLPRR
ncbi:hypothetical protein HBI75_165270 [Parastagonospora nodorum]|nr:hypothetical protein HBI75_165270 [Parastagonospora nodorum]